MSNTLFVFIKKEQVPSRDDWQKAIDELDFSVPFLLHPELDPFEDEGFSPCSWNNGDDDDDDDDDVGFEIFSDTAEDTIDDDENLLKIAADKDFCISLAWFGSMQDCAAAMIASCALVKSFDAIVSFEGEPAIDLETLIADTIKIIEEAKNDS